MKSKKSKRRSSGDFQFKYRKRSPDQIKKRANQTGGRFDVPVKPGFDLWRPKDGENVVRILPASWDDSEHYGLDVYEHRYIGADNSNYLCLNKMKGKFCPACEEAKELKDAGEDEDAKKMSFSKRLWCYIIDRDDKKPTVQIWDMSWAQDRDINQLTHNERSGKYLLIDNPDDGYDVIVHKKGKGLKTKYVFSIERESSPISEDEDEQNEILRFITENPLPDVLRFEKEEYLEKQLSGTSKHKDEDLDDDDDDDDDDRRSRRKKSSKGSKRRSRDEDDDDEDERPKRRARRSADDDDDDDDDEETFDNRRSKRRSKDEDDDDEDEDRTPRRRKSRAKDDDDDEDEDDEPKSKKRRASRDDDDDEDDAPKRRKRRSRDDDEDEDDDD